MSTPANLSEQIIAAPSGAGAVRSLGETFTPDLHTGTGRYQIPIPLQPGPGGITPFLSLTYSSTGGSGAAGLGWDLDLASVQRRTDHGIPAYDDARDRFAIQGDELMAQGGVNYRFRVERRFARIRRVVNGADNAWIVTERDGTRTFYGEGPEARLTDGGGRVAAWYVTRKQDVHGNEITYTNVRDPRTYEVCLASIEWAGCYRVLVDWEIRPDPVVSARAGFPTSVSQRIRTISVQALRSDTAAFHTYRRYDLEYVVSRWTGRSLLSRVVATGIDSNGGQRRMPPLTFGYTDADLSQSRWRDISGDRPNRSLESRDVTLVRQSGSGLPDIFETRPTGHYLRVNTGGGFGAARLVPAPPLVNLSDPTTFLSDMNADGYADLVVSGGRRTYRAVPGTGGWGATYASATAPSVDLDAPNVKLVDLTGNGLPDALRSGVAGWDFFENLGDGQWRPAVRISQVPPVRLDDVHVHVADIDGDGLGDLIYVDRSGVTVWRARGRGQFGAPYRMGGGPQFGVDFDPRLIRFVDLTGSGQADLIQSHAGVVRVAFNQAGLAFTELVEVGRLALSSHGHVEIADVLGTGADGLLFTDEGGAWRFRELFTSGPLDGLAAIDNGIGGRTSITHGSSAGHWARDLAAGRPWRTAMPTPVRVIDRVTTIDDVTGTVLEVSYQYGNGVYDGVEREFRGFARVTELDRDAPPDDPEPTARTRVVRWYHTGSTVNVRDEWYSVPGDAFEDVIPDRAWARRAANGLLRREETYADDGERRPFLVTETAYQIVAAGRASARGDSAFVPLAVRQRRTVFERTSDVRQSETHTTYDLQVTPQRGYALPVEVRDTGLGRRGTFSSDHERQQAENLERVLRTTYVNLDLPDPPAAGPYTPTYVVGVPSVQERYAVLPTGEERLLSRTRSFYDGERYRGLGYPGSGTAIGVTRGLLSARLELAFTSTAFDEVYPAGVGAAAARTDRGHYLLDGDAFYAHSARRAYNANGQLAGSLDPNGNETAVEYDPRHRLFPVRVTDAAGHPTILGRSPLPFLVEALTDANGNRTEFAHDPSTLLARRSVMGKLLSDGWQGDPPSHPTESYTYEFDAIPIRVTTSTRQVREGATFDVHRYVDGLGRIVQERQLAEADPETPPEPRFRVTGWQIYNHKGLVVRKYQPRFSASDRYAPGDSTTAVTAFRYDPLGREVRVSYPDGTFSTALYEPWVTEYADRNDNAGHITSDDPRYGPVIDTFASHLETPRREYVDALGRSMAVADDNGDAVHVTRRVLDLNDRVIEVWDARGLAQATWSFTYDLRGQIMWTRHTTASGDRFSLADAAGNAIWDRDGLGVETVRSFDALNRMTSESSVTAGESTLRRQNHYLPYDESSPDFARHQLLNLFGRLEESRDADGLRVFGYDWRGLELRAAYRFWSQDDGSGRPWTDLQSDLWTAGPAYDPPIPSSAREAISNFLTLPGLTDPSGLVVETVYDAASRPVEARYAEGMQVRRRYNAAGLLDAIEVSRDGGVTYETIVDGCAYNARGQLVFQRHGNGVQTTREYDADLERLQRILTRRIDPSSGARVDFQDLSYAYDPIGNPLTIVDGLASSSFSHNQLIPNTRTFRYDPRYRLVEATGRRHRTAGFKVPDVLVPLPDRNDYEAYRLRYGYDPAGNLTRNQEYAADALFYKSDRIDLFNGDEDEAASFSGAGDGNFRYDANGNTTHTPRVAELAYTHDHQVRYADLGGGGQVRYFRHADQRVVRLLQKNGVAALSLYLGPFEYLHREGVAGYSKLVVQAAGQGRHAQVERVMSGTDPDSLPIFFEHGDHLSSAHVLTTGDGRLLSQEEYFAYGRPSDRRDSRNRYRFIGVERDEDTGLCMTGPRTYDPVSGRFLQVDPLASTRPNDSPFLYASGAPTRRIDPSGYADDEVPKGHPPEGAPWRPQDEPGKPRTYEDVPDAPHVPAEGPGTHAVPPGPAVPGTPHVPPETAPGDLGKGGYGHPTPEAPAVPPPDVRRIPREPKPGVPQEWIPDMPEAPVPGKRVIHPDDLITEIPDWPSPGASHLLKDAAESGGEKLLKEGAEEGIEWAAKKGTTKLMSCAPVGGLVGEFMFADEDQPVYVTVLRGVGSEVGVGPLDATTVYDLLDSTGPWNYEEEWHSACTAGCHYGTP